MCVLGEIVDYCLISTEIVWDDEKALKWLSWGLLNTVSVPNAIELYA